MDWRRHLDGGAPPALLSEVAGTAAAAATAPSPRAAPRAAALADELADVPRGRWPKVVEAFVRDRALRALGLDPARPVDPRTPLGELGLDSLLAVELRNTLSAALGRPLPATLLFDHPTIAALGEHLLGLVGGDPAPAPATPPSLVGAIEDLSDEEVERQLAARARRGA
jgi:hypothetical protein